MPNDLRHAFRMLFRDKGFAAAVILTLAVGIGANTAIFSVIDGVLLRPLPFRDADRLVSINEIVPKFVNLYPRLPVNLNHYYQWVERCHAIDTAAIVQPKTLNLTQAGEPALLHGAAISANTFRVLGVELQAGRFFLEAEEREGRDHVAILSDSLWNRRFHRDRSILGKTIMLDGAAYEVAGILPPSFRFPRLGDLMPVTEMADVFKPLGYAAKDRERTFGNHNYIVIARLRPGVTPAQAVNELNVIQADISKTIPEPLDLHASVSPLQEQMVAQSRGGLLVVMGAVGTALLVLCVNLANLAFARAAGRARDFAIRAALGASRGQLIRQMLTESVILSIVGGGLGIAFAFISLRLLLNAAPVDLPRLGEVHLDATALLFALAVSVGCGLIFGILPAFRTARQHPQDALKAGSHTTTEGARGLRTRNILVSAEVGLSSALLIAAGLLIHSFVRLMNVEKGLNVEHVITANVSLPTFKYQKDAQQIEFFRRVIEKAQALPGAMSAAVTSVLPFQGETWIDVIGVEHDSRPMVERPTVNVRFVSPNYFKTLGMPLQAGRSFIEGDHGRKVVILSKATADRLWPGQDPIGRHMSSLDPKGDELFDVVGIAPDTRSANLDKDPVLMVYYPYWQNGLSSQAVVVRTGMDPKTMAGALRNAIWEVDSEVPVPELRTMEQVMSASVAQRRFLMTLVMAFAAAALALAGFGIYGVLSYTIARRRSEIGIRMALGAGGGRLRRMVVFEGMRPVMIGLALGIATALAIGRVLTSLLFQVKVADLATFVSVAVVILLVAIAACFVPAYRASRLDPLRVLRSE